MKILQRAKNVLKRFYPPPVDVFNREIRKLSNAIVEADEKISVKVAAFSNSATQHLQGIAQEQALNRKMKSSLNCVAKANGRNEKLRPNCRIRFYVNRMF